MQINKKEFLAACAPAFAIAAKQHVVPDAGVMAFRQSTKVKGEGFTIVNAGAHAVACKFKVDDYFTEFSVDGSSFQTGINAMPDGPIMLKESSKSIASVGSVKFSVPRADHTPSMPKMGEELVTHPFSENCWALLNQAVKFCHKEEIHVLSSVYVSGRKVRATDSVRFFFADADTDAAVAIQKSQVAHLPAATYDIGQEPKSGRLWLRNDNTIAASSFTGSYSFDVTSAMLDNFNKRIEIGYSTFRPITPSEIQFLESAAKIMGPTDFISVSGGKMSAANSLSGLSLEASTLLPFSTHYTGTAIKGCLEAHKGIDIEVGYVEVNGGYVILFRTPGLVTGCQSFKL